ncbi:MAG: biotin/lipoyl-containing protein, partial [Luminiphilus sp.]
MAIEIKAPAFPESVADGEVATWHKAEGDSVARDELLVEIETDKVVMEVVAPESGVLTSIVAPEGETIVSEALLALLEPGAVSTAPEPVSDASTGDSGAAEPAMGPAARALIDEHGIDAAAIAGSGKGGRITKDDVSKYLKEQKQPAQSTEAPNPVPAPAAQVGAADVAGPSSERVEKRVPMTRMRARIAERLLDATQQTAMLTTFNEVNMAP